MSFQWIIDNASGLTINTRAVVANTITRDGITRSTVRNSQPWQFEVEFPSGPRWEDYRIDLAKAEGLDRYGSADINFAQSEFDWMFPYQGDGEIDGQQADWTAGFDTVTVTGGNVSIYRARAGDFIQLGDYVYKVIRDVPVPTNSIKLHRPVIESGSGFVKWGPDCVFTVKCVEFPSPVIFARNQLGFSGPFRFVEVIN